MGLGEEAWWDGWRLWTGRYRRVVVWPSGEAGCLDQLSEWGWSGSVDVEWKMGSRVEILLDMLAGRVFE